jgi:hypothetical protein
MKLGIHHISYGLPRYTIIETWNFYVPLIIAQVRYVCKDCIMPVEVTGIDVLER